MIREKTFSLATPQATLDLGKRLAKALIEGTVFPLIRLCGPLGSGKTTLVRGLTAALPGGDQAEVSSPSFNVLNMYPSQPETAHFDLYRQEGRPLEPDMEDILLDNSLIRAVEWAEFLDPCLLPDDWLLLSWQSCPQGRKVQCTAQGTEGLRVLAFTAGQGA